MPDSNVTKSYCEWENLLEIGKYYIIYYKL